MLKYIRRIKNDRVRFSLSFFIGYFVSYMFIVILWRRLELSFYGEIAPSDIDSIITIIVSSIIGMLVADRNELIRMDIYDDPNTYILKKEATCSECGKKSEYMIIDGDLYCKECKGKMIETWSLEK